MKLLVALVFLSLSLFCHSRSDLALAAEGAAGAAEQTDAKTGTEANNSAPDQKKDQYAQSNTYQHRKPLFHGRLHAMERKLEKWHEQGKLTDQQFQALKAALKAVRDDIAKLGAGKVAGADRKSILDKLKSIQMDMVEDMHKNRGGAGGTAAKEAAPDPAPDQTAKTASGDNSLLRKPESVGTSGTRSLQRASGGSRGGVGSAK